MIKNLIPDKKKSNDVVHLVPWKQRKEVRTRLQRGVESPGHQAHGFCEDVVSLWIIEGLEHKTRMLHSFLENRPWRKPWWREGLKQRNLAVITIARVKGLVVWTWSAVVEPVPYSQSLDGCQLCRHDNLLIILLYLLCKIRTTKQ